MDIKLLFKGETNNTFIQFFRYFFVGGFATIVDWGASFILFFYVFGGTLAVVSNTVSFVIGLITNYILSTLWVFGDSNQNSRLIEFLIFASIGIVGLIITILITIFFEKQVANTTEFFQMIAKVVSTAVAFLWNFFARKYILYNK